MIGRCIPAGVLPEAMTLAMVSACCAGLCSLYFSSNRRGFRPLYRTRRLCGGDGGAGEADSSVTQRVCRKREEDSSLRKSVVTKRCGLITLCADVVSPKIFPAVTMPSRIIVVGGGAAGFFAAVTAAERGADVTILEKTGRFLVKVRISGGGRCNVTHALFETREFSTRYPRGERTLLSPFQKFSARDTVEWFAQRGVQLKTEADGRMFPVTDSSQTIVNCLFDAAEKAGVKMRLHCVVESVTRLADGTFEVKSAAENFIGDKLLLATGGCRAAVAGQLAVSLGHTLVSPVPSLFTFQIESPWLRSLAGVSVPAEVAVPAAKLRERGPLLVTHWGLSVWPS